MAQNLYTATIDLRQGVKMHRIGRLFAQNDKLAHRFDITVTENGEAADLTGLSASAYFMRPDDGVVTLQGTISGSVVSIVLPSACYEVPGHFSMIVKIHSGQVTTASSITAIFWGDGTITRTETNIIIDPAHVVPNLDELLAQIATIEAAVTAANDAADRTENMTVSASAATGSTPTATITTVNDHYNIAFGLVKGDKGDTGNTGNGINESSTTVSYQASGSGTTIPTGTWLDSPPTLSDGQYLWTRVILTYTSGNTQTFYSVGYRGADGNGTSPFSGATATTAGTSGWVPAPAAGDQNKVLKGNGGWGSISLSDMPKLFKYIDLTLNGVTIGEHTGYYYISNYPSVPSQYALFACFITSSSSNDLTFPAVNREGTYLYGTPGKTYYVTLRYVYISLTILET